MAEPFRARTTSRWPGRPEGLEGLRLVEGVALGDAVLHQLRIEVSRLVAEDPDAEATRLEDAIGGLRASMDELLLLPEVADGEHREVLEAYRMFAHDAGWRRRMSEAVRTGLRSTRRSAASTSPSLTRTPIMPSGGTASYQSVPSARRSGMTTR